MLPFDVVLVAGSEAAALGNIGTLSSRESEIFYQDCNPLSRLLIPRKVSHNQTNQAWTVRFMTMGDHLYRMLVIFCISSPAMTMTPQTTPKLSKAKNGIANGQSLDFPWRLPPGTCRASLGRQGTVTAACCSEWVSAAVNWSLHRATSSLDPLAVDCISGTCMIKLPPSSQSPCRSGHCSLHATQGKLTSPRIALALNGFPSRPTGS